jgi:hypothetical protein
MKALILICWLLVTCVLTWRVFEQRKTINALIELNHDKSVYIDAGCHGRYQGAEELLSGGNDAH